MKEETKGTFIVGYFTLLIIAAIVSGVINSNKMDKAEKALAEREKTLDENKTKWNSVTTEQRRQISNWLFDLENQVLDLEERITKEEEFKHFYPGGRTDGHK